MRALQVDRLQRRRDLADGCKGARPSQWNSIRLVDTGTKLGQDPGFSNREPHPHVGVVEVCPFYCFSNYATAVQPRGEGDGSQEDKVGMVF